MNFRGMSFSSAEALIRSENRAGDAGKRPEKAPLTIAISREVGALGSTIAAEVGQRLGWTVYDREIINKIAEEMGESASQIRGLDERQVTWMEEWLGGLSPRNYVTASSYLKHLISAVRSLGVEGRCIIVGRGAAFFLPRETTLRIRLIGDMKDRIKAIGKLQGLSDQEATRWIEETERDRAGFIRSNFDLDVADPLHYDLVLNISRLSAAECAETIVNTLHLMERREQPPAEKISRTEVAAGV